MSTYENAYKIAQDIRYGLNEYSDAYLQGTDTSGKFQNHQIIQGINDAIRYLYGLLVTRIPSQFTSESSLTGVNSVFTLPWDFGKLILFKDDKGRKVYHIEEDQRKLTDSQGSKRMYYRRGNTLVLDKTGNTSTYSLVYRTKPREIHYGQAAASSGSLALRLQLTYAKTIADYYNGLTVENITQDLVEEITDYVVTNRVATVASTPAADDWYGLVPEIPEPFHFLIAMRAIIEIKAKQPVTQEKPTKTERDNFMEQLLIALRAFGTEDGDVDYVDMFTSYESNIGGHSGWIATE